MLAAVLKGKDLVVEEVPNPSPGKNEVSIRVEYCGLCGSDVHAYKAGTAFLTVHRHNIMGHEFGGVVEELGEGVSGFNVGDKVTAIVAGAYAQFVPSDVSLIHKLPENMNTDLAALIEPTAVALRGVNRSEIKPGMTAAVVGGGPIGLLVLMILKSLGIDKVVVSEPGENRRRLAEKLGAALAVEPKKLSNAAQSISGGKGVDVTFECVGTTEALNSSFFATKREGKVVLIGVFTKPYQMDMLSFLIREASLIPSFGYQSEFPAAMKMLARGDIPAMEAVTGKIPLKDIGPAFDRLANEPDLDVKILVDPWS